MTILYLHQYFVTPSQYGGTRSYEMARRFVNKGHRVVMITSEQNAGYSRGWHQTSEEGIEVHWCRVPYNNAMSFFQRIKSFLQFVIQSASKATEFNADIIFASSTPLTIAIPAIYVKRRKKIPMVFEVRDLWPHVPIAMGILKNPFLKWLAFRLEYYAYKYASHVIVLSEDMKEAIIERYQNPEKITVVPNSCDNDLFASQSGSFLNENKWLSNKKVILYAGTMGQVNGVSYLVDVAAELKLMSDDICILVVGEGREEELVRSRAIKKNVLNSHFFLMKSVPKNKLPDVYQVADIATSVVINNEALWANSANKFFDTLASGTPIAINHGGWQKSVIKKWDAGLVLDVTNPKQAASDLYELLMDSNRLSIMSLNAKKLALDEYDRDLLANKLLTILVHYGTS